LGGGLGGERQSPHTPLGRQATPGLTHSSAATRDCDQRTQAEESNGRTEQNRVPPGANGPPRTGQLAGAGDVAHAWRPSASAGGRAAPCTSRADHGPEPQRCQIFSKAVWWGGGGGQTGTFHRAHATTCVGLPDVTPLKLVRLRKSSHEHDRRCRPTPAKTAQMLDRAQAFGDEVFIRQRSQSDRDSQVQHKWGCCGFQPPVVDGQGRVTAPTAAGESMASRHRIHGLPSSRTTSRA